MSRLAPNLFTRRFDDLVEMGRARLPRYAPEWTDHNAHDPGITLMELLAFVAEAQLYSLSRMRRDERAAYGALLDVVPSGTRPARGLLWPDRDDPRSPSATFLESQVIAPDALVNPLGAETPTFRPTHKLLWVPGRIARLESRLADGRVVDLTATNERGGPAFLPFGEAAGGGDLLSMRFECRGDAGLFPPRRKDAEGAYWAVGIRADAPLAGSAGDTSESGVSGTGRLAATLVEGPLRTAVPIVSDTTAGLLRTGALLLDLDSVAGSPKEFMLELRSPRGFDRPPRLVRIEPNVVPVVQGRAIDRELHVANGLPGASFELDVPGLRFAVGEEPVRLEVDEPIGVRAWTRCADLSGQGPDDRAYELDAAAGRITFGNGLNGRLLPAGSQVYASYAVSDGAEGGVARNRKWTVRGFAGAFGVNPDPMGGGAGPGDTIELRREARRRAREEHAMVSSSDLVEAARALPLLEVARAWVLPPDEKAPRTGVVTLVAMRARPFDKEPEEIPETARWLEAIRRRLAPRVPLGTRLMVAAPRYVGFFVRARLAAEPGRDPEVVRTAVEKELAGRLALVRSTPGAAPRAPGVPVTQRDVAAWMRGVDGVRRVDDVQLVRANGKATGKVAVPRGGLPRFDLSRTTIEVARSAPGSAP